ncbi:uncharacterized protein LOC115702497 [Cannabis sativa]|uniref:uncharacterized protein LOC115702497 n=1 Tax=Cannabis sativa TaxID=3483 RepID=UPI0011DF7126|nr:uncharacterized protein LOC115702497 [Cannabis sativa]
MVMKATGTSSAFGHNHDHDHDRGRNQMVRRRFFRCPRCEKILKCALGLRVHIENHNKPASSSSSTGYNCQFCGRSFLKPQAVNGHLRIHKGRAKASRTNNNHNILMKKSLLLVDHDGAHAKVLQEDQYQDSEKNHDDHNKITTNSVLVIDHYQDTAKDHNNDDDDHNTDQDNKGLMMTTKKIN